MSYRVLSCVSPSKALLSIVFRGLFLTSLENKQIIFNLLRVSGWIQTSDGRELNFEIDGRNIGLWGKVYKSAQNVMLLESRWDGYCVYTCSDATHEGILRDTSSCPGDNGG